MTMRSDQREWPYWEEWLAGWQLIERCVHFEGEDITPMLPPYRVDLDEVVDVPRGPWVNSQTDGRDWDVTFHFENGWEARVGSEWGVAKNAAVIFGFNRRVLGLQVPLNEQWDDMGLVWLKEELDQGSAPYLDDPDDLLVCLATIATLPSDPEARR